MMGTLPIALGAGASAELRQPLGVAVVGGLIVSQMLTLFITPGHLSLHGVTVIGAEARCSHVSARKMAQRDGCR